MPYRLLNERLKAERSEKPQSMPGSHSVHKTAPELLGQKIVGAGCD